jgi:Protein of unknown function (DUF2530)
VPLPYDGTGWCRDYIRRVQDVPDTGYPEQPVDEVQTHEIGNRTYVIANVDPLDVDGTRTVAVGALSFLAAFLLLLPFRDHLEDAGHGWWIWTCLAGFGLGVVGWEYCRRRRRHRQAGLSPTEPADPGAP